MRPVSVISLLAIALASLGATCDDESNPPGPTVNCDEEPGSRPGRSTGGDLEMQLGEFTYTDGGPGPPRFDTGPPTLGHDAGTSDAGGATDRNVTFSDAGWEYAPVGDSVEVHYGMQGGFHAQFAFRVDNVSDGSFASVAKLKATDPETDRVLASSICHEGDEQHWLRRHGALYYQAPRLVFTAAASDVVGQDVVFHIDVQVGDKTKILERKIPVE